MLASPWILKVQVCSLRSIEMMPFILRASMMFAPWVPMAKPIRSLRMTNSSWKGARVLSFVHYKDGASFHLYSPQQNIAQLLQFITQKRHTQIMNKEIYETNIEAAVYHTAYYRSRSESSSTPFTLQFVNPTITILQLACFASNLKKQFKIHCNHRIWWHHRTDDLLTVNYNYWHKWIHRHYLKNKA